jgi:hypothetical protein
MTIENAEESTFWPVVTFLIRRLHDVKNYGDTVLIIVSDYSLISISSISRDYAILSDRALCLFKVWQLDSVWIWIRCVSKEQGIDICHTRGLRGLRRYPNTSTWTM